MRILIVAIFILFVACSESDKKIKTQIVSEFSSIEVKGKLIKDTLTKKYVIGFFPSGNQSYFIGLVGWGKLDTTNYPEREPYKVKNIDNKTFYYGKNDTLIFVTVKKGDTIYSYNPISFDNPISYSVFHDKKIVCQFDFLFDELETFKNVEYDENQNIISAMVQVDYIPDDFSKKYSNEIKLAEEKLLKKRMYFSEIEYEYYK